MEIEKIKQIINSTTWSAFKKQRLVELLPKLTTKQQFLVYNLSFEPGFEYLDDSLFESLSYCIKADSDIAKGEFSTAIKILSSAPEFGFWQNGDFIFPWALDLINKVRINKNFQNAEFIKALVMFLLAKFVLLDKETLAFI